MCEYRIKEETIGNRVVYYPQWRHMFRTLGCWFNFIYSYSSDTWSSCSLKDAQKVIDEAIEKDNKKVRYIKYP